MPVISNGRIVELTASDVWAYLRNPVKTLTAWRQGVSPTELFPPSLGEEFFAQRGRTFESAVLAKHKWLPSEITIQEAFRLGIPAIFKKPRLEHKKARIASVRLVGEPDIVCLTKGRGAVEPQVIDIKSHRKLQYADQIQVTLYCYVLARMLSLRHLPAGYVRLRTEGENLQAPADFDTHLEPVDVELFWQELERCVQEIIREFKRPNLTGVLAVHGIGPRAQRILATENITTLDHLAEVDEEAVLTRLKSKYLVSSRRKGLATAFASLYRYQGQDEIIKRWKHGARAIREERPLVFKPQHVPSADLEVYFDLEYADGLGDKEKERVWLASLLMSRGNSCELHQFFAVSLKEEKKLLSGVLPYLTDPDSLVVAYAGTMADLPRLQGALARQGYDASLVNKIKESRHLDLYSFLASSVALPISEESSSAKAGYGLKEVETLFGIPRHVQMDGFEALMKYHELLKARAVSNRSALKETLLAYAAEDVQNLRLLKIKISELMRTSGAGCAEARAGLAEPFRGCRQ